MHDFEKRRRKIFSDEIISEMVREISEEIVLRNKFGITFYKLYQQVSKRILKQTKGYVLSNGHFILSIMKSSGPDMMKPYEPFRSNYTFGDHKIHHRKNLDEIDSVVEYIYLNSKLAS